MRSRLLIVAALLAASPALAQPVPRGADPTTGARPGNEIGTGMSLPLSSNASNTDAGTTHSEIAPRLPTPSAGEDAPVRAYLVNARQALAAGHTGEAQEALERAESRLLTRDVAPSRAGMPESTPLLDEVTNARRAVGAGNAAAAVQSINAALARLGAR